MWVKSKLEQMNIYFSANEQKMFNRTNIKILPFSTFTLISANERKKCSIELIFKISPFFTFTLISKNKHILVQINKKMLNQTKI